MPVAEAHDKDQFFIVDEDVCYARRAIEKVRAKKRDDAMRAKKGEGWDAGLKLHARSVTREQALEHIANQQQGQQAEDGHVGPRLQAAAAQREESQRLGAKAREQRKEQRTGGRLAVGAPRPRGG